MFSMEKQLSNHKKGVTYAIISGLCYGFLGYYGTTLIHLGLSVFSMLFWRFFISTLFMLIILIPKYKSIFKSHKDNFLAILNGIAFYTGSTALYFASSKYIGTGISMAILFTYPAVIMIFNYLFFHTKLKASYYLAFFIMLIGILCIADTKNFIFNSSGIIFGIMSSIFYAIYILISKKNNIDPKISTLMVSIGGTITCTAISFVRNDFSIPNNISTWSNIIILGVFCTALPILLFLHSLNYISSERASMLSVLEPIFVATFGFLLLG
jgi:drug/metabolite transporter (DMT)-like permease